MLELNQYLAYTNNVIMHVNIANRWHQLKFIIALAAAPYTQQGLLIWCVITELQLKQSNLD